MDHFTVKSLHFLIKSFFSICSWNVESVSFQHINIRYDRHEGSQRPQKKSECVR